VAGGVRRGRGILALLALAFVGSIVPAAAASGATPMVRDARMAPPPVPTGAVATGTLRPNRPMRLEVVLPSAHPDQLNALLGSLYQKGSPQFHHWLAPGAFARRFGPDPSAVVRVRQWLASLGLRAGAVSGFALSFTASERQVASALGVSFEGYRLADRRDVFEADRAPLLPAGVATDIAGVLGLEDLTTTTPDHIAEVPHHPASGARPTSAAASPGPAGIQPATTGAQPRIGGLQPAAAGAQPAAAGAQPAAAKAQPAAAKAQPRSDGLSPCPSATSLASGTGALTPDQAGAAYGIGGLIGAGQNGTGQTIAVYEVAPHIPVDVSTYETCFGLNNPVQTVPVDGGASPDVGGSVEADLDIEQLATQAPGSSIESYEGPNDSVGAYDTWAAIVNQDTASVISASVGLCEPDAQLGGFLAEDTLLRQAAAQGQTVLVASGDAGSESCFVDTSGPNTASTALDVSFPSSDPWVTAVGGTYVGNGPDTVWNDCQGQSGTTCATGQGVGASGGGVSRYEAKPAWQSATYQWSSNANACTTSCRNVPDIAANAGVPEVFYVENTWAEIIGTSISAPMIAGLVADTATGCAAARKGNIAPLLYGLASQNDYGTALSDVISGDNDFTDSYGGTQFPAGVGYDPTTGVGTPLAPGWSCPEVLTVSPAQASAGTAVTISGLGLEGATVSFGSTAAQVTSATATTATAVVPPGSGTVTVRATSAWGQGTATASFGYSGASTPPPAAGYWEVAADGGIFAFNAPFEGSTGNIHLNKPIVGMAVDPLTGGYWLVAADGGIFAFNAPFEGSTGNMRLNAPIVGMAADPLTGGYWLVAADGGIFAFNAPFEGSTGNIHLNKPIVGMAVDPLTGGYWLVAADGGIFAFNAPFQGSTGNIELSRPIVGMATDVLGSGYWLVASDGGIFAFNAPFQGSTGGSPLNAPIVGMAADSQTGGYWLVDSQGSIYPFNAPYSGSTGGTPLNSPVVGMAAS